MRTNRQNNMDMMSKIDFQSLQGGYLRSVGKHYAQHGCAPQIREDEHGQLQIRIKCAAHWRLHPRLTAHRIVGSYLRYMPSLALLGPWYVEITDQQEVSPTARYIWENEALQDLEEPKLGANPLTLSLQYSIDKANLAPVDFQDFDWQRINDPVIVLNQLVGTKPCLVESLDRSLVTQWSMHKLAGWTAIGLELNGGISGFQRQHHGISGSNSWLSQSKRFLLLPENHLPSLFGLETWLINQK